MGCTSGACSIVRAPNTKNRNMATVVVLTPSQVIQKLKTDPIYATSFVLDNNFPAIQAKMAELGIIVATKEQAFVQLRAMARAGRITQINYVLNVPYINDNPNYTGGYADYFRANSPTTDNGATTLRAYNWSGILLAVGAVIGGVGSALGGGGAAPTAAELAAAEAAEKERKRKMWVTIGIIAAIIVAIVVGVFIYRKNK